MQSLTNSVVIDFSQATLTDITKIDHADGTTVNAKLNDGKQIYDVTREIPYLHVGDSPSTTIRNENGFVIRIDEGRTPGWKAVVEKLNQEALKPEL